MYEKQIITIECCIANVVYSVMVVVFVTVSCVRAITDVQVIEVPSLAKNAFGKQAFVCIVQKATKHSTTAYVKRNMLPCARYRLLQ